MRNILFVALISFLAAGALTAEHDVQRTSAKTFVLQWSSPDVEYTVNVLHFSSYVNVEYSYLRCWQIFQGDIIRFVVTLCRRCNRKYLNVVDPQIDNTLQVGREALEFNRTHSCIVCRAFRMQSSQQFQASYLRRFGMTGLIVEPASC